MKNYKLTDNTIMYNGIKLYQIEAINDFNKVKKGTLGGYIQSTDNLSDDAWVGDNAKVYDKAKVSDNAWVSDNARVFDNAQVSGDAWVFDNAEVSGNARVSDKSWVYGKAQVYGNARVYCEAKVYGDADVYGNAIATGSAHVGNDANDKNPLYNPKSRNTTNKTISTNNNTMSRKKTEYRTIHDGYKEFLQYKTGGEKKSFLGIKYTSRVKWCNIWRPYYHPTWGRDIDFTGSNTHITSHRYHLEDFAKKWEYIEDYFLWASREQKRLEDEVEAKNKEVSDNKGKTHYL